MANLRIVYWHDIPAHVVVNEGKESARRQLAQRFQAAIDEAAMRSGEQDMDDYMKAWRKGDPEPCGDDIEAEAEAAVTRLEAEYDKARLSGLIAAGGTKTP